MWNVATIGLDLAKDVFQVHGADADGTSVFNRKLRRPELLSFFERLPPCLVGIEACGTSHHWARSIAVFGHDVRLIHPSYVRPFVKRGKTDANDAEAINEALTRKTMRFVPVKSAEQQASALSFRVRSLLIRQRAQMANSLRSHLAEFGVVVSGYGFGSIIAMTKSVLNDTQGQVPLAAHFGLEQLRRQIEHTQEQIAALERQILSEAKDRDTVKRLMTVPGVGPMVAMAITSLTPAAEAFKSARHFAAWIGLTPRTHSSGGSHVLGPVTKMGNKQLRSLLVLGAISVLRRTKVDDKRFPWISRIKQRRPYRVAAVALANKTARIIWALLIRGGTYRCFASSPGGAESA